MLLAFQEGIFRFHVCFFGVKLYTLPPIIMEVGNGFLQDLFRFQ